MNSAIFHLLQLWWCRSHSWTTWTPGCWASPSARCGSRRTWCARRRASSTCAPSPSTDTSTSRTRSSIPNGSPTSEPFTFAQATCPTLMLVLSAKMNGSYYQTIWTWILTWELMLRTLNILWWNFYWVALRLVGRDVLEYITWVPSFALAVGTSAGWLGHEASY